MLNRIKKIDWIIVGILFLFMGISFFVVKSATYQNPKFAGVEIKTLIFYILGFFLVFFLTLIDYRLFLKKWYFWYGIGLSLLVLVLFVGVGKNGAHAWLGIGPLSFQPAEFMKICLIFTFAAILDRYQGKTITFGKDLYKLGILLIIPFYLVIKEPHLGNAITFIVILCGMLWIANIKLSYVVTTVTSFVVIIVLFVILFSLYNEQFEKFLNQHNVGHWYGRLETFIRPEKASSDIKYHSEMAKMAIGSGGLLGEGYMRGAAKNRHFISYTYSDSIFAVIGEEFGFVGSSLLILIFFVFIYRLTIVAFQCADRRGMYMIIGITILFIFQIYQNIGMMIGLMPITGITLPFISYGGTALLINMISIGIVFSIQTHQDDYILDGELSDKQ